jgi:uncharacterized protein YkwD
VRPDGPLRELSRGGRLDLRPRERALRRDGVGAGASCPNPDLAPGPDSLGAIAEATLCLLNGERADRGLGPLGLNAQLSAAAGAYAQDLVAGSYFSHTGRDGSDLRTRVARTGYLRDDRGWALGENLAWGTGSLGTPGSIMAAWMNSPGHRDNILNPAFREIGIGVVIGNPALADGAGATYATEFGAIEDAEPVASSSQPQPARRRTAKRARRHARARVARHGKHHRHHKRHRAKHRRISAHA